MRIPSHLESRAFTLAETLIAVAAASTILAAMLSASVGLQRSFNAIDHYFSTHMQQIRIVDYLTRDVKRGLSVTASGNPQTVIVTIPRYIIQAGDPEASDSQKIGTPRNPTYSSTTGQINYGPTPSASPTAVKYEISGLSIIRSEDRDGSGNWVQTTIASSTDNLLPETTDFELANTEYTTTAVKFQPISGADREGTVLYSTSYLRNRRR